MCEIEFDQELWNFVLKVCEDFNGNENYCKPKLLLEHVKCLKKKLETFCQNNCHFRLEVPSVTAHDTGCYQSNDYSPYNHAIP